MSHYIRIDENNNIIYGFSDVFESPQETDICILDDVSQFYRHFSINKVCNPPLFDNFLKPIYKYENDEIRLNGA